MAGKYVLTNKAVDDLSKIWEYTVETWSENQADKYYFHLINSCQLIAGQPTIGKSYTAIADNLYGYKVNRHIIFYRQIPTHDIEIIRILHDMMDLKNRLEEE